MKGLKAILVTILFLISINIALGTTVTRQMPSTTEPEKDITITFDITGTETGTLFTLEDLAPEGFELQSWDVTGSTESKEEISTRFEGTKYGWSFNPSSANVKISYIVKTGPEGNYTFSAVWFDSSGMNTNEKGITIRNITCGDSVCEGSENCGNCVTDCGCITGTRCEAGGCIGFCGNDICDSNENNQGCPEDCPKEQSTESTFPFDKKKDGGKSKVLFFVIPLLVLLVGFGIYQMRKKKWGFGGISSKEVKATVERVISEEKGDTEEKTKEIIARASSELPSIEGESLDLELPTLEGEEEKKEEEFPAPQPRGTEKIAEEHEKKKSEIDKKIKEVDRLVDKVFGRKNKEK